MIKKNYKIILLITLAISSFTAYFIMSEFDIIHSLRQIIFQLVFSAIISSLVFSIAKKFEKSSFIDPFLMIYSFMILVTVLVYTIAPSEFLDIIF